MKHDGPFARALKLLRPSIQVGAYEPWGRAVFDHFNQQRPVRFYVHDLNGICVEHSTLEAYSVPQRSKRIHDKATSLCRGRVLDVGTGAGRDALTLKAKGFEVLPIDNNPNCVEIMRARGLCESRCLDVYEIQDREFDTILIMQMTIGLVGTLDGLTQIFLLLGRALRPDRHILLDSMSPVHLSGSPRYPGQRRLELRYGRFVGEPFPWLYVDFDVLSMCAKRAALETEFLIQGVSNHDYLARVFKRR